MRFHSIFDRIKSRLALRKLDWCQALERGEKLLKAGKAEESVPYFRQSMKTNPGEPGTANAYDSAKRGLVLALEKLGRSAEAEKLSRPPSRMEDLIDMARAAAMIMALVIAPIAVIWLAAPSVMDLFPQEPVPVATFSIKRGEAKQIDARFSREYDISAGGAIILPAGQGDVPGAWEGYDYRGAGAMETAAGRLQGHEVAFPGQAKGLMWAIGKPDFMGKTGGARIYLSAGHNIKTGRYKIWLAGAYLDHKRRKSTARVGYSSDPADQITAGDPFWPNETIPYDRAQIPIIEVTVE